MKKQITFILTFLLVAGFAQSQELNRYVVVGLRGSFNSTWLLNNNQLNDKGLKYKASWGYSGGAMVGVHYAKWGAVMVEGLYSTLSQKMESSIDSLKFSGRTDLTYYELPVLLRFKPKEYKYIEAGIKISSLANARRSYETSSMTQSNEGVKNNFEKSNLSLVLGWGGAIWGEAGGILDLGIRVTYGLSDITSASGGKGNDYYTLNDGSVATPKPYKPTNTATIGFHLTYDLDLGWWFHDNCKRKYKFFLFQH